MNRQFIQVYDRKPTRVRVESPTVTEEGLFPLGDSNDHRPDVPQLMVMLPALDPLGLPVATHVVSGERADDRGHGTGEPASERPRVALRRGWDDGRPGHTEESKAAQQEPEEVWDEDVQPVWADKHALTLIWREREADQPEQMAEGYERQTGHALARSGRQDDQSDRTAGDGAFAHAGYGGHPSAACPCGQSPG